MSSYEKMLADAMANAEKKAKQDKWLALAQAGMALMSSTQPNLAGAIGEAGKVGIEALQSARDTGTATQLQLAKEQFGIDQDKAALARAASSAGRTKPRTASGILSDLDTVQKQIATLTAVDPMSQEQRQLSEAETVLLAQLRSYANTLSQQLTQVSGADAPSLADVPQ
jgi:hypothetical protein